MTRLEMGANKKVLVALVRTTKTYRLYPGLVTQPGINYLKSPNSRSSSGTAVPAVRPKS